MRGGVVRPALDRRKLGAGQVHLGVGAFFKAHLAPYTQQAIERAGGGWGVIGVSLRRPDARDELAPQDHLFTVTETDAAGPRTTLIGVLKDMLVAPENPGAVVDALADPAVKIVTLTITEKGYCLDPASGALDENHPDIRRDLAHPEAPRTAAGLIAAALKKRLAARAPLAVLSCDNLSSNGARLRASVRRFAELWDPALARAVDDITAFPNTMVDRITPATTPADLDKIAERIGLRDEAAVVAEPFTQWVIEDRFMAARPAWEEAGALIVDDVAPYELAKLRLLNGAHSTIAYLGQLAGYDHVADVMAEPAFASFIAAMQTEEIAPTLRPVEGLAYETYIDALLERFRNPALRHRTAQIAMDGSQKLPPRLLETARAQLERGGPIERIALAIAAWIECLRGVDRRGAPIEINDPLADRLMRLSAEAGDDPEERAAAFLRFREVFGADLADSGRFRAALARGLAALRADGVIAAVKRINAGSPAQDSTGGVTA
ncbi:mannitol dehydrogenase family protein [Amphiplicatus metriothermophilus]|uniref:mannitol dehydrogenase family protein n=1 Tax=Amphiplicatus metriothermophilus TaxID=1519374 RepID=UPI0017F70119|nr:mannitol dehydrogenase family protein [Amphiplicatus metriothermophilus]MBB5518997.1 fructuronate reductase [Amphiplicatus metriothermophilus]